jgi:hypothetical protein
MTRKSCDRFYKACLKFTAVITRGGGGVEKPPVKPPGKLNVRKENEELRAKLAACEAGKWITRSTVDGKRLSCLNTHSPALLRCAAVCTLTLGARGRLSRQRSPPPTHHPLPPPLVPAVARPPPPPVLVHRDRIQPHRRYAAPAGSGDGGADRQLVLPPRRLVHDVSHHRHAPEVPMPCQEPRNIKSRIKYRQEPRNIGSPDKLTSRLRTGAFELPTRPQPACDIDPCADPPPPALIIHEQTACDAPKMPGASAGVWRSSSVKNSFESMIE